METLTVVVDTAIVSHVAGIGNAKITSKTMSNRINVAADKNHVKTKQTFSLLTRELDVFKACYAFKNRLRKNYRNS